MRTTLQIVGLAVGLLVVSVVVVAALAVFIIPPGTFDGAIDAIEGIEEEDEGAEDDAAADSADTQQDG